MNNRWYDADPVISNAMNLMRNSDEKTRKLMADFIIKEASNLGVEIDKSKFDCFWRRRSEDESFSTAEECLKALEDEDKRELSLKLISTFKNHKQI